MFEFLSNPVTYPYHEDFGTDYGQPYSGDRGNNLESSREVWNYGRIHVARLLMEKSREKRRPLYIAFLDLEKAFDRVPNELIWYTLRQHLVPEELMRWVQLLYHDPKSKVCGCI